MSNVRPHLQTLPRNTIARLLALVVGAAAVAAVLAAIAIRSLQVSSLFPGVLFQVSFVALGPRTQEDVANAEFVGVWLGCLAVLAVGSACCIVLKRLLAKGQRNCMQTVRPNPSIERTASGALRAPTSAAHVKR